MRIDTGWAVERPGSKGTNKNGQRCSVFEDARPMKVLLLLQKFVVVSSCIRLHDGGSIMFYQIIAVVISFVQFLQIITCCFRLDADSLW